MAEAENPTLKPFYQRASEAEDRLARLEAALASKRDSGNEDSSKLNKEIQEENKKLAAENGDSSKLIIELQEENKKLAAENAKHQYRILHLVRAVRNADEKLESKS